MAQEQPPKPLQSMRQIFNPLAATGRMRQRNRCWNGFPAQKRGGAMTLAAMTAPAAPAESSFHTVLNRSSIAQKGFSTRAGCIFEVQPERTPAPRQPSFLGSVLRSQPCLHDVQTDTDQTSPQEHCTIRATAFDSSCNPLLQTPNSKCCVGLEGVRIEAVQLRRQISNFSFHTVAVGTGGFKVVAFPLQGGSVFSHKGKRGGAAAFQFYWDSFTRRSDAWTLFEN
ncbi:hypothetical protein GQ43DRAFT_478812 [Delitschia confertaspora ATCC 74209]|uniref:Uncharacterized protein n=1 Tax=Delitschia confertaspora ATCC 74209 TaxID=1513339 RepID=A0A9P4MUI8_9PLEO|nr:hypothetical protein GQ43DRAFT_478812 [Delitschia confertaspora ATCC 74209]